MLCTYLGVLSGQGWGYQKANAFLFVRVLVVLPLVPVPSIKSLWDLTALTRAGDISGASAPQDRS